jgi:glycosyltransferase involved in cell wall biosynthesis
MRFAFVTPRYGADVHVGAEHACRLLAEQISRRHDVEVFTTCARSGPLWKNEDAEGQDRVRGVRVRRFPVVQEDRGGLDSLRTRLIREPHARADELDWIRRSGPWSPALLEHLKKQHRSFDVLVFFALTHATTVFGLEVAPERSILFPYALPDDVLRLGVWSDVLSAPRALGFCSAAESQLLRRYVLSEPRPHEVVGIGIDPPPRQSYPRHQQDPADDLVLEDEPAVEEEPSAETSYLTARGVPFRRRHRLYGPLALYGGRVEPDNGCEEMLDYFDTFAAQDGNTSLVLLGVKMMRVPDAPYLRQAGVLPDRERMVAFEAADVTIVPATDDLLAQPLLESFAVGTPVLASATNAAAVEHCKQAHAGLCYGSRDEFVEALRTMMTNTRIREQLGDSGRQYVEQHHRWDAVLNRFDRLVTRVKPR